MLPIGPVPFFSTGYQLRMDENSSLGLEIRMPLLSNISGLGYGIEYKVFPFSELGNGFYIASRIIYTDIKSSDKQENMQNKEEEQMKVYSLGLVLAYEFTLGNHFITGFGFGLEYYTGPSLQDKELEKDMTNTFPHFRLDMGWSF